MTRLRRPLRCQASRQTVCTAPADRCRCGLQEGNSQGSGGAQDAVVGAKNLQQARREHGVAILATLAVFHADEHAAVVDVGQLQGHPFGDAQSGAVAGQQHGTVLDAGDLVQEALDFVGANTTGSFCSRRARGKSRLSQGISRVTR